MRRPTRHTVTPEDIAFWRGLIRLSEDAARKDARQACPGLVRQAKRYSGVPVPGQAVPANPFFVLGRTAKAYADLEAADRAGLQAELASAARAAATALAAHEAPAETRERKDIDG